MVISFDLDDMLILGDAGLPSEGRSAWLRLLGLERLRLGTVGLFRELRSSGHRIMIYTTSFRSQRRIRWTFFWYGIPVDGAINQVVHRRELGRRAAEISKYPPAFGIDLHVDDSLGVQLEGERHHFRTLIVHPGDVDWVAKVLQRIHSSHAFVK